MLCLFSKQIASGLLFVQAGWKPKPLIQASQINFERLDKEELAFCQPQEKGHRRTFTIKSPAREIKSL